ncbi:MAG: aspartate-semialdehyde dehydrogenase [Gammaproteobacteria bacterium]|nr:aspartate-semialdehyde dehydrogenase [Gammaproteobacteria bacterium]HBW84206.1 aspartate-semialdehyde dehydrogenase [Gammaproteobacteria bacterium]|tara:strand:+ start:1552 stop:2571 length:1020 start_codon:yes stop_codon:yes gene_type:complete
MRKYNVAIVGATGAVGEALISILEERDFPVEQLFPLASERSAGSTIMYRNKPLKVQNLAEFDFSLAEIGLFSAGGGVSAEFAPKAAECGCIVVDNTSHFRYKADIPLVIPEVNPEKIADYQNHNIIANPNCSTIQMLVALKPIHDAVRIKRISVATYQAVSGTGKEAVEELAKQTAELLNGRDAEYSVYPRQIAFNVLPHIDQFMENGYTKEEMKMHWETQKIFDDTNIMVSATCVRVPVFFGHSEAIQIETEGKLSVKETQTLLASATGVKLIDGHSDGEYPTAFHDSAGQDEVFVGRIREDLTLPNGLNLWVVSDNVRKGAALNSIQIAEELINSYL